MHIAFSITFSVIRNLTSLAIFIFMFRVWGDCGTCLFDVKSFKEYENPSKGSGFTI